MCRKNIISNLKKINKGKYSGVVMFFIQKQQNSGGDSKTPLQGDKCLYTVYKQPISLDRICLHDVPPTETAGKYTILTR